MWKNIWFFTVANRSLRKPLVFVHSKALLLMPEHPCSRAPKPAVLRDLQTCEKIFDFFTAAKLLVLQTCEKLGSKYKIINFDIDFNTCIPT